MFGIAKQQAIVEVLNQSKWGEHLYWIWYDSDFDFTLIRQQLAVVQNNVAAKGVPRQHMAAGNLAADQICKRFEPSYFPIVPVKQGAECASSKLKTAPKL